MVKAQANTFSVPLTLCIRYLWSLLTLLGDTVSTSSVVYLYIGIQLQYKTGARLVETKGASRLFCSTPWRGFCLLHRQMRFWSEESASGLMWEKEQWMKSIDWEEVGFSSSEVGIGGDLRRYLPAYLEGEEKRVCRMEVRWPSLGWMESALSYFCTPAFKHCFHGWDKRWGEKS